MTAETIVGGVCMDATGIRIGNEPRVLLSASLFYFRLPLSEWQNRLTQVRDSGYTCIDVYFPWNFHETAPGVWSFEGRRDLAAFLDLAHSVGLLVIARPGPYICSEWDGGGLPAWLGLDPGLRVRQHEPRFLTQVGHWFGRVLPLLAERQYPAGPVVIVQLENELDFFDCADRPRYVSALRDLALSHGITVPLIACAGQGDLAGATGDVADVVPACNFYPDDDSPDIEAEVRHYADLLGGRGLPLLVTETNRRHRTLRRLLAAGASLLGPYLQSSGWNFGYTPSAGNWGAPGNLMSHCYDLGGYVSSTGAPRPEHTLARVLARVVDTLGPALARATPSRSAVDVAAGFPTSSAPATLDLDGGGRLLGLPNLGAAAGTAVVAGTPVAVAGDSCPLMPLGLPLGRWGGDLTLALASADLVAAAPAGGALALAFASDVPVTVVLDGLRAGVSAGDGLRAGVPAGDGLAVSAADGGDPAPAGGDHRLTVEIPVGRRVVAGVDRSGNALTVTVVVLSPPDAARLRRLGADGTVEFAAGGSDTYRKGGELAIGAVTVRQGDVPAQPAGVAELPPSLEALGVYRGRGAYAAIADLAGVEELLLVCAADLVDLTIAGQARETVAGFGATERVDVRGVTGPAELHATVEIWGHANFDDARLPALGLGALRGLGTVWTVTETRDISAHWTVSGPEQWAGTPAPIRSFGGWSSTRVGRPVTYTRCLESSPDAVRALHLAALAMPVTVALDDGEPATVAAENPWLLLPAGVTRVALTTVHHPSGAPVRPQLLTLAPITGWTCATQSDETLLGHARDGATGDVRAELPLVLSPGAETWVDVDVPAGPAGWVVRLAGRQVRATAWAAGECLGRVWLAEDRPRFMGGDPDILWIPAAWTAGGTRLTLLLRGLAGPAAPELTGLRLVPAE